MEQINCETEIKKRYYKNKKVANALIRIISEAETVVHIKNLCAHTPDKLKFFDLNLLNCIEEEKELSRLEPSDDSARTSIEILKNKCKITVSYEKLAIYNHGGHYWLTNYPVRIRISGPEESVKQEREALRSLL